ncbi:MAG TPA: HNH endonuclease signature motif containing protein [Terriglobia bacterium]|nr:HNH endonuclease signature motif containing protein [Terriglobia bacterium]
MRFWWVNQNQTFRQESAGGYLWSPKRKAHGARNPFYEFMREVAPGDLVLSFEGTYIRAVGIVQSYCYECPKPPEFGMAGPNWEAIGWKVDVHYHGLINQIRPADHMAVIQPRLPAQYAPLHASGRGLQNVYLTNIPDDLMEVLADLIGPEVRQLMQLNVAADVIANYGNATVEWEEHLRDEIASDRAITETEKEQLILARRGQGRFRQNVQQLERFCRVTKVDRSEHLRASHCKPWRDCRTNEERLNGENGLLLTPSIDHLFDRGFISFEDKGELLISPVAHFISLNRMGVPTKERINVGAFSEGQKKFLDFHRNYVFLKAVVK